MKQWIFLIAVVVLAVVLFAPRAGDISPQEAHKRVQAGTAVLVDVREPEEWKSGVAEPAVLLSLSSLKGDRSGWTEFLAENKDKELILYCRTGNRSGQAMAILEKEGFRAGNAGGFSAWRAAGLPTRKP